jgi:hypothetical protein
MPEGTTSSPLVEPDVRIALIRLSQKCSAESMRRQSHSKISGARYEGFWASPVG